MSALVCNNCGTRIQSTAGNPGQKCQKFGCTGNMLPAYVSSEFVRMRARCDSLQQQILTLSLRVSMMAPEDESGPQTKLDKYKMTLREIADLARNTASAASLAEIRAMAESVLAECESQDDLE